MLQRTRIFTSKEGLEKWGGFLRQISTEQQQRNGSQTPTSTEKPDHGAEGKNQPAESYCVPLRKTGMVSSMVCGYTCVRTFPQGTKMALPVSGRGAGLCAVGADLCAMSHFSFHAQCKMAKCYLLLIAGGGAHVFVIYF
jgi:hypothetical protein